MNKMFASLCALTAGTMMMILSSCTEEVINQEWSSPTDAASLRVRTRGDGDLQSCRLYIMQDDACVSMISADGDNPTAETVLPVGRYTIYAVGSNDISRLALPEKESATPESEIGFASASATADVLIGSEDVLLSNSQTLDVPITLQRKVFLFDRITITQVPTEVTKISVTITPLRQRVKLNGQYGDLVNSTTIELTSGSEGVWEVRPQQYAFPSSSEPTVSITFTTATVSKTYTLQADKNITANHKFSIDAVYTEPQNGTIKASVSAVEWDADESFNFNFKETNRSSYTQGEIYFGYYLVAVDNTAHTAVALRKGQGKDITSEAAMETARAKISNKPIGATGEWRLPTVEECQTFLADKDTPNLESGAYYCLDGEALKTITLTINDSDKSHTVGSPVAATYNAATYYRPVIDVSF